MKHSDLFNEWIFNLLRYTQMNLYHSHECVFQGVCNGWSKLHYSTWLQGAKSCRHADRDALATKTSESSDLSYQTDTLTSTRWHLETLNFLKHWRIFFASLMILHYGTISTHVLYRTYHREAVWLQLETPFSRTRSVSDLPIQLGIRLLRWLASLIVNSWLQHSEFLRRV